MTVSLYARRKQWPLETVQVELRHSRIHAQDCADCDTREGMLDRIDCKIQVTGPLTTAQKVRLLQIARKCPVHRTLKGEIEIRASLTG